MEDRRRRRGWGGGEEGRGGGEEGGGGFFFQAEDGIRDYDVTGVQTCALPISHDVLEKLIELQPTNKFQSEPWSAELHAVLDTNRGRIHLHPPWLNWSAIIIWLIEQRQLPSRILRVCLRIRRLRVTSGLLDTKTSSFVKFPEPRNNSLPRTRLSSIRFHERPIGSARPVLILKVLTNEHDERYYRSIPSWLD